MKTPRLAPDIRTLNQNRSLRLASEVLAECTYPIDLKSLPDDVDVIRFANGSLYVNGFRTNTYSYHEISKAFLAWDVINVVLDPVPPELVAPFAEHIEREHIKSLGWTMLSSEVVAWIEQRTGKRVEKGGLA